MISGEKYTPNGIDGDELTFFYQPNQTYFEIHSQELAVTIPIPAGHGPPRGGLLLSHNLGDVAGKAVCDLGTDCYGLNVVSSALLGAQTACGIERNPEAIAWLQAIVENNSLLHTVVRVLNSPTFSFTPANQFDVIIGNLPMMPSLTENKTADDFYHYGGGDGWNVIQHYLNLIPLYLSKNGYIRLLLLDFLGIDERTSPEIPSAFERFEKCGLMPAIITRLNYQIHENHPFIQNPKLFSYVQQLYPSYSFSDLSYDTVVMEGRAISSID